MDFVCENLGAAPTFSRSGSSKVDDVGTSRIDVTFSKGDTYYVDGWNVSDSPGLWDHFPITFYVKSTARQNPTPSRVDLHDLSAFSYDATDWGLYKRLTDDTPWPPRTLTVQDPSDIQRRLETLVNFLQNSAKASTRLKTAPKRSTVPVQWWDDELRCARASLARTIRRGSADDIKLAKGAYKALIFRKKQAAYERFINDLNDVPDKQFFRRIRGKTSSSARLLEDDATLDDTLNRLCDAFVGPPIDVSCRSPFPQVHDAPVLNHPLFDLSDLKNGSIYKKLAMLRFWNYWIL
ncbi:hypothetical protein FOZ62_011071 [Perkinsus olseni]|uniref:Uncharacterized protein n=1 Tax=Perkinsus olseni TaxID=32597 RepID=A0A7J6PR32_PEROL|nr:hypothetical protein FOZ62_011071 [Perkinsus olseni]